MLYVWGRKEKHDFFGWKLCIIRRINERIVLKSFLNQKKETAGLVLSLP